MADPTPDLTPANPSHESLLAANRAFYATFEALDLEAMGRLWETSERVFCVHPGWQALRGRDAVLESWGVILANTTRIQITLTGVEARVDGGLGIVTHHEHILSQVGDQRHTASAVSTNLFAYDADTSTWMLFHHHASLTAAPDEIDGPVN